MNKYRKDHNNLYEAFNKVQEKQQLLNELHQLQDTLNEKGGWWDKTLAKSPIMNKLAGGVSARAQQRVGAKGDFKLMQQKFNQTLGGLGKDVDAEQFKGWLKQNTGVDASNLPEVQQLSGRIPNKQIIKMMPKLVDDMRAIKMSGGTSAQQQIEPQDPNSIMGGGAPGGGAPGGGAPGGDPSQQIQNLQNQLTDDNPDTPDEIAQLKAQIAELQKQLGQQSGAAPASTETGTDTTGTETGTDTTGTVTGTDTTGTDTTGTETGTDTTGTDTTGTVTGTDTTDTDTTGTDTTDTDTTGTVTGTDTTGTETGTDTTGTSDGLDQDMQGAIDGMSPDELDEYERTLTGTEVPAGTDPAAGGAAPESPLTANQQQAQQAKGGTIDPATGQANPTNANTNMGGGEAQGAYTLNKFATQLKDAQASGDTKLVNQIANDIINYASNSTHGDQASNVKMAAKQLLKRNQLPQAGSKQLNDCVQTLLIAMGALLNEEIKHQQKPINEQRKYNTLGSMGFMSSKWGRF